MSLGELPEAGETVGAFRIVRRLGAGGMGAVYEVEPVGGGASRAMKLMLPHLGGDHEFVARFLREARATRLIDSPHVVHVFDVGRLETGALFMIMELLAGRDLETECRVRGALPVREAVGYVIAACAALQSAHGHGIIHRDLKPANLFLSQEAGSVALKVLDFGISKAANIDADMTDVVTLTNTDSTLGSPKYMSPEQLRSAKAADARSDIWSLGVILYRLVSTRLPYEADSIGAYASMIFTEPPTPLSIQSVPLPDGFEQVVMRCLRREPGQRYQTVAQLVAALAPFAPDSARATVDRVGERAEPKEEPPVSEAATIRAAAPAPPDIASATRSVAPASRGRSRLKWLLGGVGAVTFGAIAVALSRQTPPTVAGPSATGPTSAAPEPPAIRCADAHITGAPRSAELARLIGVGACARIALATGRAWIHEGAQHAAVDPSDATSLEVVLALEDRARITLTLGTVQGSAESDSPMEAVEASVSALQSKLTVATMSEARRAGWGTACDACAHRIEKLWRSLSLGGPEDREPEAREVVRSDEDSPWSHAILGLVLPRGSTASDDAFAAAEARLDRLHGPRRRALGAVVRMFQSRSHDEESLRELRHAYSEAPDDAEVAGLYAAMAIGSVASNEGFAVVDRFAERFPTRSLLALRNAIASPPHRDAARNERYVSRLLQILPERACSPLVIDHRISTLDFDGCRTAIALCRRAFGRSLLSELDLLNAKVELASGHEELAYDLANAHLSDPQQRLRTAAFRVVTASYLARGALAEAHKHVLAEFERDRQQKNHLSALLHARVVLRIHLTLGTKPPDFVLAWFASAIADVDPLESGDRLALRVELALAKPPDPHAADALLAEIDALGDPSTSLVSFPLVLRRRGNAAAIQLLRGSGKAADEARRLVAVDAALALEATNAGSDEVLRTLDVLSSPDGVAMFALDRLVARPIAIRALERLGKKEEAVAARKALDARLVGADPALRGALNARRSR